jgi:hypothetical protein
MKSGKPCQASRGHSISFTVSAIESFEVTDCRE